MIQNNFTIKNLSRQQGGREKNKIVQQIVLISPQTPQRGNGRRYRFRRWADPRGRMPRLRRWEGW